MSSPEPGQDARRSRRFRTRLDADLAQGTTTQRVYSVDVSRHGVFLATPTPPRERFLVRVTLYLPDGPLEANGFVSRRVAQGEQPGVGLQFFAMAEPTRRRWDQYITWLAGAGVASDVDDGFATFVIKLPDTDKLRDLVDRALRSSNLYIMTPLLRPVGSAVAVVLVHPESQAEFVLKGKVARVRIEQPRGLEVAADAVPVSDHAALGRFLLGADPYAATPLPELEPVPTSVSTPPAPGWPHGQPPSPAFGTAGFAPSMASMPAPSGRAPAPQRALGPGSPNAWSVPPGALRPAHLPPHVLPPSAGAIPLGPGVRPPDSLRPHTPFSPSMQGSGDLPRAISLDLGGPLLDESDDIPIESSFDWSSVNDEVVLDVDLSEIDGEDLAELADDDGLRVTQRPPATTTREPLETRIPRVHTPAPFTASTPRPMLISPGSRPPSALPHGSDVASSLAARTIVTPPHSAPTLPERPTERPAPASQPARVAPPIAPPAPTPSGVGPRPAPPPRTGSRSPIDPDLQETARTLDLTPLGEKSDPAARTGAPRARRTARRSEPPRAIVLPPPAATTSGPAEPASSRAAITGDVFGELTPPPPPRRVRADDDDDDSGPQTAQARVELVMPAPSTSPPRAALTFGTEPPSVPPRSATPVADAITAPTPVAEWPAPNPAAAAATVVEHPPIEETSSPELVTVVGRRPVLIPPDTSTERGPLPPSVTAALLLEQIEPSLLAPPMAGRLVCRGCSHETRLRIGHARGRLAPFAGHRLYYCRPCHKFTSVLRLAPAKDRALVRAALAAAVRTPLIPVDLAFEVADLSRPPRCPTCGNAVRLTKPLRVLEAAFAELLARPEIPISLDKLTCGRCDRVGLVLHADHDADDEHDSTDLHSQLEDLEDVED